MKKMIFVRATTIIIITVGLLYSIPSAAIEINGMIESDNAVRIKSDNEYMKLKNRFQLKVEHQISDMKVLVDMDVWNDAVKDSVSVDIDEIYIEKHFKIVDLKVGKQKITWGKTIGIILTDVLNPRNWTEFYSMPYEDLKIAISAVKLNHHNKHFEVEGIFIPIFSANRFATSGDWAFYSPLPSATMNEPIYPKKNIKNSEFGLKVSGYFDKSDYSLSYFNGWNKSPAMHFNSLNNAVTPKHHRIQNIGFESETGFFNNIFRGEMLYVDTEDKNGKDYTVDNSYFIHMTGLERTLRKNLTLDAQFIQKIIMKYNEYVDSVPTGFNKENKAQNTFTVEIRDLWVNQTVKPQIWIAYNEATKDYFVKFNIEHEIAEGVSYTVGVDTYGGKDKSSLYGQFDNNDQVYGKIKYSF